MDVKNMSIYRHPSPGYTLPLWLDGKPIRQSNGKSNAVFSVFGSGVDRCGLFRTDDDNVKKAIESSREFQRGGIVRLKSDAELKFETLKKQRIAARESFVSAAAMGLFDFEGLKKKSAEEVREFAVSIGIDVEVKGEGHLPKKVVLTEVENVLYPNKEEVKSE